MNPNTHSIKYLTHSVCFDYRSIPKLNQNQLSKWLTQSVCFYYWSIIKSTQNKVIKIANTECLIQLLLIYRIKPTSTKFNISHRVYTLITGQLSNEPKIHLVKYLTQTVWFIYRPISEWNHNSLNKILT